MALASQAEVDKVNARIEKHMKKLNPDGTPKGNKEINWENKAKALLRFGVRDRWMMADNKLAFLLKRRIKDDDPNTRTKWLQQCDKCKKMFKLDEVEVDHIIGESSFVDISKAVEYTEAILNVGFKDLQLLCKEGCHHQKTACERIGVDWTTEEGWRIGGIEIETIQICKEKRDKGWLQEHGITPESNAKKRREQIVKYLTNN